MIKEKFDSALSNIKSNNLTDEQLLGDKKKLINFLSSIELKENKKLEEQAYSWGSKNAPYDDSKVPSYSKVVDNMLNRKNIKTLEDFLIGLYFGVSGFDSHYALYEDNTINKSVLDDLYYDYALEDKFQQLLHDYLTPPQPQPQPQKKVKIAKPTFNKAVELFNPQSDEDRFLIQKVLEQNNITNDTWYDLVGFTPIHKKRIMKKNKVDLGEELGVIGFFKLDKHSIGIYIEKYNSYGSIGGVWTIKEWLEKLKDRETKNKLYNVLINHVNSKAYPSNSNFVKREFDAEKERQTNNIIYSRFSEMTIAYIETLDLSDKQKKDLKLQLMIHIPMRAKDKLLDYIQFQITKGVANLDIEQKVRNWSIYGTKAPAYIVSFAKWLKVHGNEDRFKISEKEWQEKLAEDERLKVQFEEYYKNGGRKKYLDWLKELNQ